MPWILIGQYDDVETAGAVIADLHDAGVSAPVVVQPLMLQAQRDLARGLEDTDCYTSLQKLIPRRNRKPKTL